MKATLRIILLPLLALLLVAAAIAGGGWWWLMKRPVPMPAQTVDYMVESGMGPRKIAQQMAQAGIDVHEDSFVLLARYTEADKRLQAGAYQAQEGDTLWALLQRMVEGNMLQTRITIVEGWTFAQMLERISQHPQVKHTLNAANKTANPTDDVAASVIEQLDIEASHPEGLFHPDTYVFVPGTTDLELLKRAYQTQLDLLEELWPERAKDLPIESPYEALILASIVEKETGRAADRERIAGVFMNRLKANMLLQTDPTVIYGMGERYQGRIRKSDLTTDTPWHTYTRAGLPPTPIALPSKASILAVLHPEEHGYYYFVARGDGSSEFSKNLNQHNRAVAKYILKR